ncbi:MAG: nucleotidyltransferase family protein [Acutalibacteraceae bacterium]|nr:nucleotidyltransferase family protein [Acutalibacteraceae bacterium]
MKRCEILSVTGIIAEFNPLHTGHELLLKKARERGTVVAVISGNFVQRGDLAIAEKRVRARAALLCGADLVLELPCAYSMSTAQNFALGGVSALKAVGCDTLLFGSEIGDVAELKAACDILKTEEYSKRLGLHLATGVTFAAAREKAAWDLGLKSGVLSGANNNLAIEYMAAADNIGANFHFQTLKRQGAGHDSSEASGGYASASLLRERILSGDRDFCKGYIPETVFPLFDLQNTADIRRIENAVLAVLRTRSIEELKNLPDISEGLENKLFSEIRVAGSLDDVYNGVKAKRYTLARIRRLVLSAFIGLDNTFFMKQPPYIRVLGFNGRGMALLKEKAGNSEIPVVTRVSEIKELSEASLKLFKTECRATDLFALALPKPAPCGLEYTAKIIKAE